LPYSAQRLPPTTASLSNPSLWASDDFADEAAYDDTPRRTGIVQNDRTTSLSKAGSPRVDAPVFRESHFFGTGAWGGKKEGFGGRGFREAGGPEGEGGEVVVVEEGTAAEGKETK
jgi:hypothetical protein